MTVTISRLYDNYSVAEKTVNDLEAAGLRSDDISIVASNADNWYKPGSSGRKMTNFKDKDHDGTDDRVEGAEAGAGIGAVVGGAAGLLTGLGILAIPGVGPVVAAGWLAATAAGAVAGGATGGIVGALTQAGISKEEAPIYAEGIRRGGAMVTARVPDAERSRFETILNRSAVSVTERGDAYRRSGWTGFDEKANPYNLDDVRKERTTYQSPGIR